MFIAIYQWNVRQDQEEAFLNAWSKLTEIIYREQGSLGSRLHKSHDGRYLAYAQWPSEGTFMFSDTIPLSAEAEHYRRTIRQSSERILPDTYLTLKVDKLAIEPWSPQSEE